MKLVFVLAVAAALQPEAGAAPKRVVHRESTEWTDAWFPNTNMEGLPRVLLIGDSSTRAYFSAVEMALTGKAFAARIATAKAIGDPALPQEVELLMSEARFDVVHLNVGMHGWAYTEDEYKRYLPELVDAVRRSAPRAQLIWAMTAPGRKDQAAGASNGRIEKRNAIAREYFAGLGQDVAMDDLNLLMTPHSDLPTDDVHLKDEGSRLMARQVAESVLARLPSFPPDAKV